MGSRLHIAVAIFAGWGAALGVSPVFAQVHACVDPAGKKTYAQACPSGTVSQKEFANSGVTPATPPPTNAGSKESVDNLSRTMQAERIAREKEFDEMLRERKERCEALAKRLHMYEHAGSIEIVDPDTGLGTLVESAQRAATLKQLRQDIKPCR